IAYAPRFAAMGPAPDVFAVTDRAAHALQAMGAHVEERCPDIPDPRSCGQILFTGGYADRFGAMSDSKQALADPRLVATARAAGKISAAKLRHALDQRYRLGCALSAFFDKFDLLLTPTTICPAF